MGIEPLISIHIYEIKEKANERRERKIDDRNDKVRRRRKTHSRSREPDDTGS